MKKETDKINQNKTVSKSVKKADKIFVKSLGDITADNPAKDFDAIDRLDNKDGFATITYDEDKKNIFTLPIAKDQKISGKNVIAETKQLRLSFKQKQGGANKLVIRDVDLFLYEGEILALCGESGSGKSVITTAMQGLLGDSKVIESGKIIVDGEDVTELNDRQWYKKKLRGKVISSVFQNPMTTLDPTMKIGSQIIESAIVNKVTKSRKEAKALAIEFLRRVRMPDPEGVMKMYPHQLSGGMKQRVVIACVFIVKPKIIILDEPTTALDPTVQAEILSLIVEMQQELKISMIFITHDLGVVSSIADRVAIMYAGKVVEHGNIDEILQNPKHPYTWGLLLSMPDVNDSETLNTIPGAVPSSLNLIVGEAFAQRNAFALDVDLIEEAPFFKVSKSHFVASWLYDKRTPYFEPQKEIMELWNNYKEVK